MVNFFEEKVHPGDLTEGFSDLEMTWLLYCAGAATGVARPTVISTTSERHRSLTGNNLL